MRAAVATDAKDAAIGGAKAGAVGGALGGAGRAYAAVRALGASSKLVASAKELQDANKLYHVFRSDHILMQKLVARYGSQQAAYKVLQQAVVKALEQEGKLAGPYEVDVVVGGMRVTVRGVIIDGVVRIGTAFVR